MSNWTKIIIAYCIAMIAMLAFEYRADKYYEKGFKAGKESVWDTIETNCNSYTKAVYKGRL